MEYVCPVCNALTKYLCKCERCNGVMKDKGPITDYLDEYSPYLPISLTANVYSDGQQMCTHLFYCTHCDYDKEVKIPRIKM